jgi:hypothetical protein
MRALRAQKSKRAQVRHRKCSQFQSSLCSIRCRYASHYICHATPTNAIPFLVMCEKNPYTPSSSPRRHANLGSSDPFKFTPPSRTPSFHFTPPSPCSVYQGNQLGDPTLYPAENGYSDLHQDLSTPPKNTVRYVPDLGSSFTSLAPGRLSETTTVIS